MYSLNELLQYTEKQIIKADKMTNIGSGTVSSPKQLRKNLKKIVDFSNDGDVMFNSSEGKFGHIDLGFGTYAGTHEEENRKYELKTKLLQARIFELKSIIYFLEDEPTKSKEFIKMASNSLPGGYGLLSKYAVANLDDEKIPEYVDMATAKTWAKWLVFALVLLFVAFRLITGSSYTETDNTDVQDYCDISICK